MTPNATTAAWTRKLTLNPCTSTPKALLEETDMTVMSTDAEIDPMIWRNEVMIAVPCGRSSGGSVVQACPVIGIMMQAMPTMRTP